MFISLSKDHAILIRTKLLENLVQESDRNVRNKISDAVAEVGRQYSENSQLILSRPCLPSADKYRRVVAGAASSPLQSQPGP